MPMTFRFIAFAAGLSLVAAGSGARAQSDLEICAAATPQFPQACGCVIERAQAAGITGPVLSRLLANDMSGVPMAQFQSYGLIFVECIQAAVLGTVGAPTTPAPPALALPTPAPQIAAPVPTPAAPAPAPAEPVANAGQWTLGRLALRHDAAQTTAEVMSASGRRARVFCDPRGGGWLTVDGVARGPGLDYEARFTVIGGRGVPDYGRQSVRIEGDLLALDMTANDIVAIAGGSEMRVISAAHGLDERFGLSGSSRTLRALECIDRSPFQVAPLVFEYTGDWLVYPAPPPEDRGTAAFADLDTVAHADLVLACTDYLSVPSWRGPSDGRGYALEVTLDGDPARSFIIDLLFNRGSAVPLDGMPEGFFRAVRDANLLRLRELQGGQMVEAVYDLSGLEAALQSLGCPPDAGTPLPPPPEGWHLAQSATPFGQVEQTVRFATLAGQRIEFYCPAGGPLRLRVGPFEAIRRMTMPATVQAGGVAADALASVVAVQMAEVVLPYDIDRALPGAERLAVQIGDFGLNLDIPLEAPRPLIDALACAPAQPVEPMDPDMMGDFSGVDDQPWEAVFNQTLGQPTLVVRGLAAFGDTLHIGCDGLFALSATVIQAPGDILPVSFQFGTAPFPEPAIDFRRSGAWWVATDRTLLPRLLDSPFFGYSLLRLEGGGGTFGTTALAENHAAMCR